MKKKSIILLMVRNKIVLDFYSARASQALIAHYLYIKHSQLAENEINVTHTGAVRPHRHDVIGRVLLEHAG